MIIILKILLEIYNHYCYYCYYYISPSLTDKYITSLNPEDWEIYAGDHALHSRDRFERRSKVKRIFFHDKFFLYLHHHRKGSWVTADNDIGMTS